MEDGNLKQVNELATDISKKTWEMTKHLSKWSWEKVKEGCTTYQKWTEEQVKLGLQVENKKLKKWLKKEDN